MAWIVLYEAHNTTDYDYKLILSMSDMKIQHAPYVCQAL